LQIQQGEIFDIDGSLWIVVDDFHNRFNRYDSVHCAPVLTTPELFLPLDVPLTLSGLRESRQAPLDQTRLQLEVPLGISGGFASLGLMKKKEKRSLRNPLTTAHAAVLEQIRGNLVRRFSLYTIFDLDDSHRAPPTPGELPSLHPGTILAHTSGPVCVIDHWGCFNQYPLIYVAPVVRDVEDPCPLDVEITLQFQDLFSKRNFVRTDDFSLIDRREIETSHTMPLLVLKHGLVHKISRALILKFGQKSLLL
jgi:hypothetical protein